MMARSVRNMDGRGYGWGCSLEALKAGFRPAFNTLLSVARDVPTCVLSCLTPMTALKRKSAAS